MEGMSYIDGEPRWQAFEGSQNGQLPESLLAGPALDYSFCTILPLPHTAAEYELESCENLAPDCLLSPVSLDGDLDASFSDSTPMQWRASYFQDFDPLTASMEPNTQDAAKGTRKEVSRSFSLNPPRHKEDAISDHDTEASRSK